MAATQNLLTLPGNAGHAIVQTGAVIACPLLGTDQFVRFCIERGLSIDRERLIRLERLGLFAPVFRVRTPDEGAQPFYIPVRRANDWFTKKWAWDTTSVPSHHEIPDHKDRTQEGYYSIFQIDYLHLVLGDMTLHVLLDAYLDHTQGETIDWQRNGERCIQSAEQTLEALRTHEYRRSVALLCQYVSNRYYPLTQSDQRTIQMSRSSFSDHWIIIHAHDWDWYEEVRSWDPHTTERLFDLTPEKLRHAYGGLAVVQSHCDPLERWYQLTQFVSVRERAQLKGDALRAETLRGGAHMLRLLHKDLYGEELPQANEVTVTIRTHVPELAVRQDVRRYIEFVVNRFGINPQPKVSLFVEGPTEEVAVLKIFEEYFGAHPGTYGIEIIVLGGVDVATGAKEDRFRAIFRLMDYLHHHQTITFLILDNERYARKLKGGAKEAKSIHSNRRYVTRPEYIRIWRKAFEFDNFSSSEIAAAMNELAKGSASFTGAEVAACKKGDKSLKSLYHDKAHCDLQKDRLSEILVEHMLSPKSRRTVESRPIIQTLERVVSLAAHNPFPTTQEIWGINQASKYLGKKRKPNRAPKTS